MTNILNDPEAQSSYENKKYFDWKEGKMMNPDPTIPPCSYCGKKTDNVVLVTKGTRDFLVCEEHRR